MSTEDQIQTLTPNPSDTEPSGSGRPAEPARPLDRIGIDRLFATATDEDRRNGAPLRKGRRIPGGRRLLRLLRRCKRRLAEADPRQRDRNRAIAQAARRLRNSGLLDPAWYVQHYPDVFQSGEDAARHYLLNGVAERRDPGPWFSTAAYLDLFPDLAYGQNPLLHFLDRVESQRPEATTGLVGALDALPEALGIGLGTILFIKGWCYAAEAPVQRLGLRIGSQIHPIADHSHPRPDIFDAELPRDGGLNAFFSGFSILVPFAAPDADQTLPLTLVATLADGRVLEKPMGRLVLRGGSGAEPVSVSWPPGGAKVAICMATHEPPLRLFERQIASIKAQTHGAWICVISDDGSSPAAIDAMARLIDGDPRFLLRVHANKVGFYRNFERALQACPADADFVALCDQDDYWYPDKIATLIEAFTKDTQLAYADVRIVGEEGTVRSDTFWVTRRNNFTALPALLAANTIIGAAAMFRFSLLAAVLPFPERLGSAYHDHWIALNALVQGSISYIDRPLHDYVQHGANVIGHKHDQDAPGLGEALLRLGQALRRRQGFGACLRQILEQAAADRTALVAQKIVLARILLLRHPGMPSMKRSILSRFSALGRLSVAVRERIFSAIERRPTLNHEGLFLRAVLGDALRKTYYGRRRKALAGQGQRERNRRAAANFLDQRDPDAPISFARPEQGRIVPAMRFGEMAWIFGNIAPLRLRPAASEPRRVNLLLATINFDYLFGGYIGMFNLALRLRREGHRIRIVLLEKTDVDLPAWRAKIQKYPGLTELFDVVELAYRYDRGQDLDVHPDDAFIATNGWSAHVAHRAVQDLQGRPFLFMVQEYEPFFGPMNTQTALLRQAYDLPQTALFSTAILRDYFAENRIGVFAGAEGAARSAVFHNAIQAFAPTRASLTRPTRRILFYARPESHAARNLFELGLAALVALFQDPGIDPALWSVHGIGSIKSDNRIELKPGVLLHMVPKTSLQDYAAMLPGFDVGLSLMLTPHPSLVPLEMASAGLWTVTNVFANKTSERLKAISSNLIGVEPTLEGIVTGLGQAMARVDDLDARLAGAKIAWPTDWDRAFDRQTIATLNTWLGPKH